MNVLIAGGGPTGCALALTLARNNIATTLIEARPPKLDWDAAEPDGRVTAIRPRSQRWLEQLGVWEHMSEAACHYGRVEITDADGTGSISFHAADFGYPHLGAIVENRALLGALWHYLPSCPNLRVLCPAEIHALHSESGDLALQVDNLRLNADLIIAADGANSRLRRWAGLDAREREYGQRTIAVPIRCERQHEQCARQSFVEHGPLALLPLARDPHQCALLWSLDTEVAERYLRAPTTELARAVSYRSGLQTGAVELLAEPLSFPLSERVVSRYWCEGLVLVGDAAHSVHPLAGLGLNMGLDDCATLAEELASCDRLDRALTRYQQRRERDNRTLAQSVRALQQIFGAKPPLLRWLRNLGMRVLDRAPPVKRQLLAVALGLLSPDTQELSPHSKQPSK